MGAGGKACTVATGPSSRTVSGSPGNKVVIFQHMNMQHS